MVIKKLKSYLNANMVTPSPILRIFNFTTKNELKLILYLAKLLYN